MRILRAPLFLQQFNDCNVYSSSNDQCSARRFKRAKRFKSAKQRTINVQLLLEGTHNTAGLTLAPDARKTLP